MRRPINDEQQKYTSDQQKDIFLRCEKKLIYWGCTDNSAMPGEGQHCPWLLAANSMVMPFASASG